MTPYEFCVIRYVHSLASQEFVNIGLILWIPEERRFGFRISDRYARLSNFFHGFDGPGYRQTIRALVRRMERMSDEINSARNLVLFRDAPPSFEVLLAALLPQDGSTFQCSEILGGIADEPMRRLEQLAEEFVERFEAVGPRVRRDEAEIGTQLEFTLARTGLLHRLQTGVQVASNDYAYRFKFGWMNGTQQVLEPISLDYLNGTDVIEKANNWSGKLLNLSRGGQFSLTGIVAPPTRRDLVPAFDRAVRILQMAPHVRQIVPLELFDNVLPQIEEDLQHDGR
jgi:hypothetical protein